MKIVQVEGEGLERSYKVAFEERTIDDILALDDGRDDEVALAAAARVSEIGGHLYETLARPIVRSLVSQASAKSRVDNNPIRQRRYALSDRNPLIKPFAQIAEIVRAIRKPVDAENPFVQAERFIADLVGDAWNLYRDVRDNMIESWVFWTFGSPLMQAITAGDKVERISEAPAEDLRTVPEVRLALNQIDLGGYAEAVIRMLILLARSRGAVRRDRLERSHQTMISTEPFASLGASTRNRIIHRETIIAEFAAEEALATLPLLIPDIEDRLRALALCEYVAGPPEEMDDAVKATFEAFRTALDLDNTVVQAHAPSPPKRARVVAKSSGARE
jgi:hypothetical protein